VWGSRHAGASQKDGPGGLRSAEHARERLADAYKDFLVAAGNQPREATRPTRQQVPSRRYQLRRARATVVRVHREPDGGCPVAVQPGRRYRSGSRRWPVVPACR